MDEKEFVISDNRREIPTVSPLHHETIRFRRPEPKDEIDRIARQMVKRMMEAGVIDP